MNKNIFIVAFLMLALPFQLCAYSHKRNQKSPENLKIVAKVVGYTAATLLTHWALKPNSKFIGAPQGISIAAATGVALYGIGDVFESSKARRYGRWCVFASAAAWLSLIDILPIEIKANSTIKCCFRTLIYFGLFEAAYAIATEAKEEYKRFRGDDYDDED